MSFVEVTDALVRSAGEHAEKHHLKGYDAVHLAAAQILSESDAILASGNRQLVAAASSKGLATVSTMSR